MREALIRARKSRFDIRAFRYRASRTPATGGMAIFLRCRACRAKSVMIIAADLPPCAPFPARFIFTNAARLCCLPKRGVRKISSENFKSNTRQICSCPRFLGGWMTEEKYTLHRNYFCRHLCMADTAGVLIPDTRSHLTISYRLLAIRGDGAGFLLSGRRPNSAAVILEFGITRTSRLFCLIPPEISFFWIPAARGK